MECSQVYAVNSTEKKYIRHINNTNRQFDGHVEESRRVADSLKRTAMIFKNPEQYLYAHHILADAYLKARMYPEALKQTSIFYYGAQRINSKRSLAIANWDLINYRMALGDSSFSIINRLDRSANLCIEVGDTNMASVFLVSKANFYSSRKKFDEANDILKYINSLIGNSSNYSNQSVVYHNIADNILNNGDTTDVAYYLDKALLKSHIANNIYVRMHVYENYARYLLFCGEEARAISYVDSSISLSEDLNNLEVRIRMLKMKSNILLEQNKPEIAYLLINDALVLQENESRSIIKDFSFLLEDQYNDLMRKMDEQIRIERKLSYEQDARRVHNIRYIVIVSILVLFIAFSMIYFQNIRHKMRMRELDLVRISNEKTMYELEFLKQQLGSHTLLNSLSTIYYESQKPSSAIFPELILDLSEIIRHQLYYASFEKVPLEMELNFLDKFIHFQSFRMAKIVQLSVDLPDVNTVKDILITPMLLLVPVENAFKFVSNSFDRSNFINISIQILQDSIRIVVVNSFFSESKRSEAGGIGLENLKKRLAIFYPGKHFIDYYPLEDSFYFKVEIKYEKT
jgi:tetratricopeptide (TPR) repeat protein